MSKMGGGEQSSSSSMGWFGGSDRSSLCEVGGKVAGRGALSPYIFEFFFKMGVIHGRARLELNRHVAMATRVESFLKIILKKSLEGESSIQLCLRSLPTAG